MTNERDIEQLSELLRHIKEYADGGVYDSAIHQTILVDIERAEVIFNRIIDGYLDANQMPPMKQTNKVSELQKLLHHAKHDIPSPPIELKISSRMSNAQVAIYTLPT